MLPRAASLSLQPSYVNNQPMCTCLSARDAGMIGRAHAFVTDRQFPKSDLRSTNIGVWQSGTAQIADLETRRFSFTFT